MKNWVREQLVPGCSEDSEREREKEIIAAA